MKKVWLCLLVCLALIPSVSKGFQPDKKRPDFNLNNTSFDAMELDSGGSTESMDVDFDLDSRPAEELYENAVNLEAENSESDEAAGLYFLAAAKGCAAAQYKVGRTFYAAGNHEQALTWLRQASDQGHADARSLLRKMHAKPARDNHFSIQ